ncbi:cysteine hydrolase [Roseomonas sp. HJA6]|uniref:Cysteine hydrolase n=1 Tax=Roseomonas alba TaxID=2846776 RepID=A0ABS7AAI6_9PROT|nr:isochorismatase family cysteine hydrolase [Neoroseomonas alba]MBW6399316.1 cysteine hydrolase [Neoroseomonas alba]
MTPAWQDPSHTALIAGDTSAGAATAGVFRVLLDFVESQGRRVGLDWASRTLAPDAVWLRCDPDGAYFCARIDLLLRSNGIATVVLAEDLPAGFRANATSCLRALGYEVVELPLETALATWRAAASCLRGWQPAVKAASLLPDLRSRLDPARTAVIFIDVQNDFCHRQGAVGRNGEPITRIEQTVPRLRSLLAAARQAGTLVVHVKAEYGQVFRSIGSPYRFPAHDRREPAVWTASAAEPDETNGFAPEEVEVCLAGSWGGAFVDGMEPAPGEALLVKHRYSAFRDTGLQVLLRANGISTLVFGGVTTNCCVESAVREAAMRDFYTIVAEDCVAVKDRLLDLHEASLEHMGLYFALRRPLAALREAWGLPAA